jgi:glutamate 5-kinase
MGELMRRKRGADHQRERHRRHLEIRYGDNDRLAARVATMVGADLLVLMSDIDGLYTAPPPRSRSPVPRTIDAISPRSRPWLAMPGPNFRAAA